MHTVPPNVYRTQMSCMHAPYHLCTTLCGWIKGTARWVYIQQISVPFKISVPVSSFFDVVLLRTSWLRSERVSCQLSCQSWSNQADSLQTWVVSRTESSAKVDLREIIHGIRGHILARYWDGYPYGPFVKSSGCVSIGSRHVHVANFQSGMMPVLASSENGSCIQPASCAI